MQNEVKAGKISCVEPLALGKQLREPGGESE